MRIVPTNLAGLALALAFVAAIAMPAAAQEVEYLSTNRDWHAFQFTENGHRVCYMASRPTQTQPANVRRGDIFTLITHRPAENSRNVVSIIVGYTFRPNSQVQVAIGTDTFTLFTEQDTAWARDAATDLRLVQAMQRGSSMVVRGTSSRGTQTTDTYSLAGFSATYQEIGQACNVH